MVYKKIILSSLVLLIFIATISQSVIVSSKNGPCTPGELVWVECNLCTCNAKGIPNPVCANMWCQPTPALKEAKLKELLLQKEKQRQLEVTTVNEDQIQIVNNDTNTVEPNQEVNDEIETKELNQEIKNEMEAKIE
ncbi:hypothetical protein O3M35_012014 [Rhynocoris fuscipes]|uniref:Pacifastin domain-containing protein n=1 Tax=Rhynocoris fuscipes TaxID=488301 RepID=A0AAW1CS99_9HEMI